MSLLAPGSAQALDLAADGVAMGAEAFWAGQPFAETMPEHWRRGWVQAASGLRNVVDRGTVDAVQQRGAIEAALDAAKALEQDLPSLPTPGARRRREAWRAAEERARAAL